MENAAASAARDPRVVMLEARAEGDTDTGRRYRFFETDRDLRILRTVELEFLPGDGGEIPDRVMADKAGNIHFTTVAHSSYDREGASAETGNYYYVTDSDGTLLARYDYTGRAGWLVALYDGRVGLCCLESLCWGISWICSAAMGSPRSPSPYGVCPPPSPISLGMAVSMGSG